MLVLNILFIFYSSLNNPGILASKFKCGLHFALIKRVKFIAFLESFLVFEMDSSLLNIFFAFFIFENHSHAAFYKLGDYKILYPFLYHNQEFCTSPNTSETPDNILARNLPASFSKKFSFSTKAWKQSQ